MEAAAFADVAAAGNVSHVSSCVSSYSSISDMAAGRVGSAAVGNFSDGAEIACEIKAGTFAGAAVGNVSDGAKYSSEMAAGRVGSAAVGNFSDSAGAGIACESVAGIFADARSS